MMHSGMETILTNLFGSRYVALVIICLFMDCPDNPYCSHTGEIAFKWYTSKKKEIDVCDVMFLHMP